MPGWPFAFKSRINLILGAWGAGVRYGITLRDESCLPPRQDAFAVSNVQELPDPAATADALHGAQSTGLDHRLEGDPTDAVPLAGIGNRQHDAARRAFGETGQRFGAKLGQEFGAQLVLDRLDYGAKQVGLRCGAHAAKLTYRNLDPAT